MRGEDACITCVCMCARVCCVGVGVFLCVCVCLYTCMCVRLGAPVRSEVAGLVYARRRSASSTNSNGLSACQNFW